MNYLNISNFVNKTEYDYNLIKKLKEVMNSLEEKADAWGINVDTDDMNFSKFLFFNDCDFEYLEDIKVDKYVHNYSSINGCLLNKNKELIWAPKKKRLTLDLDKIYGIDFSTFILRDNFNEFLHNSTHRNYFENVILKHKNYIIKIINNLLNIHKTSINIPVEKVVISDDIIVNTWSIKNSHGQKVQEKLPKDITEKDTIDIPKVENNQPFDIPYDLFRDFIRLNDNNNEREQIRENIEEKYMRIKKSLQPFSTIVYGNYNYNTKTITLYINAMKKISKKTGKELEDLFLAVLIHEMFHAYHYSFISNNHNSIEYNDYSVIAESLASFVEYLYCNRYLKNTSLSSSIKKSWSEHSVLIYPYSGAKMLDVYCNSQHLRNIFSSSYPNRLMNPYWPIKRFLFAPSNNHFYHYIENFKLNKLNLIDYFYFSISSLDEAETRIIGETLMYEFK